MVRAAPLLMARRRLGSQSYNHKEPNYVNRLNELGSSPRASRKNSSAQPASWFQPGETLSCDPNKPAQTSVTCRIGTR